MQFIIHFSGTNTSLPLSYNYYVQSMIYKAVKADEKYSSFLHDKGYVADNHCFRLFTFSCLKGKYQITDKSIVFYNDIFLEIRTVDPKMNSLIFEGFKPGSRHKILNSEITVKKLVSESNVITGDSVHIKLISPVAARIVDGAKSIYYSPEDEMFYDIINRNFISKYSAFNKEKPGSTIKISDVSNVKKVVTQYKNSWINAYFCDMILKSEPECLDFLYNTGIGCKNSQGFGMFNIIK